MRLVDRLPGPDLAIDDEGDTYFHDDDTEDPSGPANYAVLVEAADSGELTVIRSVLIDAGIPFIVKGEGISSNEKPQTSRPLSDHFTAYGPSRIAVPKEYLRQARDILHIRIYKPVSELRVKALELKLASDVIWSAVWLVAGFGIAYFVVPDGWDYGLRLLIYVFASLGAVSIGNAIKRSRRKAKEKHPWMNE